MVLETIANYSGIIFLGVGFTFTLPLIWAILYNRKHNTAWPLFTTSLTAAGLWVVALTWFAITVTIIGYYFWLSSVAAVMSATAWSVLLVQSIRKGRAK